jgi:protein TonB
VTPPPQEKEPTPRETHNSAKAASAVREHQITTAPLKLPPHVEVPNDKKVEWPEGFVHMSHADLAAADISKIHSTPSTGKSDSGTDGGGSTTGEGPGGAHLYRAEWYREPRDSEIDGYMRPGQSSGRWAKYMPYYSELSRRGLSRTGRGAARIGYGSGSA